MLFSGARSRTLSLSIAAAVSLALGACSSPEPVADPDSGTTSATSAVTTEAETATSSAAETEAAEEASSPSDASEERAFHFASGDLPLGTFDSATVGADLFNPCTEITDEEYAVAGIRRDASADFFPDGPYAFCYVVPREPSLAMAMSNFDITREQMLADAGSREVYPDFVSDVLPEMLVYGSEDGAEGMCHAQVDTQRGAVRSIVSGDLTINPQKELCSIAQAMLEVLYIMHSE